MIYLGRPFPNRKWAEAWQYYKSRYMVHGSILIFFAGGIGVQGPEIVDRLSWAEDGLLCDAFQKKKLGFGKSECQSLHHLLQIVWITYLELVAYCCNVVPGMQGLSKASYFVLKSTDRNAKFIP